MVELIEPGYGFVAGASGFILEYRDLGSSGVKKREEGDRDGLMIRSVDDHLLDASASGNSELLVYDILGQLLHRVRKADVVGGDVRINVNVVGQGVLPLVEEGSGRS